MIGVQSNWNSTYVQQNVHINEGQKPETAVQGLNLLCFGTAHLIFHVLVCGEWCCGVLMCSYVFSFFLFSISFTCALWCSIQVIGHAYTCTYSFFLNIFMCIINIMYACNTHNSRYHMHSGYWLTVSTPSMSRPLAARSVAKRKSTFSSLNSFRASILYKKYMYIQTRTIIHKH